MKLTKEKLKSLISFFIVQIALLTVIIVNLILNYRLERCEESKRPEVVKIEYNAMGEFVDSLIFEIESIINKYPESKISADSIVKYSIEYNLHPVFMLSQGILESHLGTTGLARKTNSVWNLEAFDHDHSRVSRYKDPNYSIEPYAKLIATDYLTEEMDEFDLMDNFTNHIGLRYASDPRYERKLLSIFKRFNNERIDSLYYSIVGL